jgi:hypothetical protein
VTGKRGKRRRKLMDNLKEGTGFSHLKEEALDRTMWRTRFGRGFGPVVRQTNLMNIISFFSLSYDRSKDSSKASSPHSAIQSFLFEMRVTSSFPKVIQ